MYTKKTMLKEKVIRVLADNFRLYEGTDKKQQAVTCSILLWELVGLRMCRFGNNDCMEVYNPTNHTTEFRFNMKTGEEIL